MYLAAEIVLFRAAATCLDTRGVLTSRQGTGTRTPRGRKRQKKPNHRKVPRFFPGRLAFNGRDASLLPTPGVQNIYI